MTNYGYQNGLSQQAISEYRSAQISSRIGLVQLILSMAIPWGLMGPVRPFSDAQQMAELSSADAKYIDNLDRAIFRC